MAQTTHYRSCTVNHVIIPDDVYTFSGILATHDTAIISDPTRPGHVELARVKPTQTPNVYLCEDATIVFRWSRLSQANGRSSRGGLKHLTSTPAWRNPRQKRREACPSAPSQS